MRLAALALVSTFTLAVPAGADPFCDALMNFVHDAPNNEIATTTLADRSGAQVVARAPIPGARCLVSPYNPLDIQGHKAEQSVYCFWNAPEESYAALFASTSERVASCMGQPASNAAFATRLEYDSNYGVVRVSADQMTNDWAISVTIMPVN